MVHLQESEPRSATYDAFISYRRPPVPPAAAPGSRLATVAADLQERLQNFERPWHRLRRGVRVFRDDADFDTSTKAWRLTESALMDSDWLILIVHGDMDARWVQMELDWWLQHQGAERIVLVSLEDDPQRRIPTVFSQRPSWIDLRPESGAGVSWEDRLDDAAARVMDRLRGRRPRLIRSTPA